MNLSMTGFSPRRVAWATAFLSLFLVPVHSHVPCEVSSLIMVFGIGLLLLTGILSLTDRSGKKVGPFWVALVAVLAHSLCVH
jgi:hypothetical protein